MGLLGEQDTRTPMFDSLLCNWGGGNIPWGTDHWLGADCVDMGRTTESLPPSERVCLKF